MSTRGQLQDRIADDLDRADLSSQIQDAVTDAIQYYETERFTFNEVQNVTHTFSISTDAVALTNLPVYFFKIDRLRMQYSGSTNLTDLYQRDIEWLMAGQDAKTLSRPLEFAVYGGNINFDSMPDQAYVSVIDGVKRVSSTASLSLTTNASAWFNEAAKLIRARAKAELCAHVIRDYEQAAAMQAVEQIEYKTLKKKLNTANTGRIRPTTF